MFLNRPGRHKNVLSKFELWLMGNLIWNSSHRISLNIAQLTVYYVYRKWASLLPIFGQIFPVYTPWKHRKTYDFLLFSGGIKWKHWPEMGWKQSVFWRLILSIRAFTTKKLLREKVTDVSKKVTHNHLLRFFLWCLDLFFNNFGAIASYCSPFMKYTE